MGCKCGERPPEAYVVTLQNGRTVEVKSERQARIEITKAGGGRYEPKK